MTFHAIVWVILIVLFLALEASTVTMVSLWFAFGALAGMIAALSGCVVKVQIWIFLGVSAVLLAALRPLAKKYFTPKIKSTNIDSVVGSRGYVTAAIDNVAASGRVELNGTDWTARSTSGAPIAEGTLVQVDRIEGVKVFVTPAEVPAQP